MIDLHMHTTASDGQYSPVEVLKKCEEAGLSLISLTDHLTTEAYHLLKTPDIRSLFSGKILTGCEFMTQYKGQRMEILGYGIDVDAAENYLTPWKVFLKPDSKQTEKLIQSYLQRGIPFDPDYIRKQCTDGVWFTTALWKAYNERPEFRNLYFNPQSSESGAKFARFECADYRSPFFIDRSETYPNAKEICQKIHEFGGLAFIAHPLSYSPGITDELESLIEWAQPDGLEVWYPTFSEDERESLLSLCQKHHLLFSGGSDFHNDRRLEQGNIIGMPQLADIFPTESILKWVKTKNTI